MKAFLNRLALFILPFLLLFLFIEYRLRTIQSSYEIKRDGLVALQDSIQILAVGNSHAGNGIDPMCFKLPAYNLAFGSQSILYDKQLVLKYIPMLKKLKYVIISIDYPSLYWGYEREFFYYRYFGFNVNKRNFWKERISFFFNVYSPQVSLKYLFNHENAKHTHGWAGQESTDFMHLSEAAGKDRVAQLNNDIKLSKLHDFITFELESLIVVLKQNKITPILITSPCSKYFNNNLDKKIVDANLSFIHQLQAKYNLIYFDAQHSSSFSDADFFNVDHLNKQGAIKFSKQIDSVISSSEVKY